MNEKELTYGETIKQPFPERDEIEWIKVEVPKWFFGDRANGLISNQKYNCDELLSWAITSSVYNAMKTVYENSKDFKVEWKLK